MGVEGIVSSGGFGWWRRGKGRKMEMEKEKEGYLRDWWDTAVGGLAVGMESDGGDFGEEDAVGAGGEGGGC